jgi:uncharacterized protein
LNATSSWDLRGVNAFKNALNFMTNVAAIVFFVWNGVIDWPHTLVMMIGTVAGGFAGVKLTKVLDPGTVRAVIIFSGCVMTAIYVYRFWL